MSLHLGVLRIVLVTWILVMRSSGIVRGLTWSGGCATCADAPWSDVFVTGNLWLSISPVAAVPVWVAWVLFGLYLVLGVLAALGISTRVALLGFTLIFGQAYAQFSSTGFFGHAPSVMVLVLIMLVLLPGTCAVSVDRWRTARTLEDKAGAKWGERVLLLLLTCVYMSAGIAKLRHGGADWLNGDALRYYFYADLAGNRQLLLKSGTELVDYIYLSPPTSLAKWLREVPGAILVMSWMTLVLELGFGLVFVRRARNAVLLATIGMHVSILVLMQISFLSTAAILACFLRLPTLWTAHDSHDAQPHLRNLFGLALRVRTACTARDKEAERDKGHDRPREKRASRA